MATVGGVGEARADWGSRIPAGSQPDLMRKRDAPDALNNARVASNLVDNYLTLSSAERRRFHGHGQAQSPLMRESRKLMRIKYKTIRDKRKRQAAS